MLKIKDLINDKNFFSEIINDDIMKNIKKNNILHRTGEAGYTNYALLDGLRVGIPFYILEDTENHYENGDYSWCFCIAIKYYNKWYCLTDQG